MLLSGSVRIQNSPLPPESTKFRSLTKTGPFNTTAARQSIALKLIEENKYCW